MKALLPILLCALLSLSATNDCMKWEMLTLRGVFMDKNLYVRNPFHASNPNGKYPVGAQRVRVNGKTVLDYQKKDRPQWRSVFEIDLKSQNLSVSDSVVVEIDYYRCSKPRMLNPQAIGIEKEE